MWAGDPAALRRGDRVRVLAPPDLLDREGFVEVPIHTHEPGERRIGVRLDTGGVVWATAVESLTRRRHTV